MPKSRQESESLQGEFQILSKLKVCTGYRVNGKIHREMPSDLLALTNCEPVYERVRGWSAPTTGVTTYKNLPAEAKRYLTRIEELAECRIDMISTGSRRDETIILNNPLKAGRRVRPQRSR